MNDYEGCTDEELIRGWAADTEAVEGYKRNIYYIEREILSRLRGREATEMLHPDYEVRLKPEAPKYDVNRLIALRELLPPQVIEKAYTAAHQETIEVPDKWDGRVMREWPKRYGHEVRKVIDHAQLPEMAPKLVIKRKEGK